VNSPGCDASLTDDLATPVEPTAAVLDDADLPGPVTSPAAENRTPAETRGSGLAGAAAGAEGPRAPVAKAVVRRLIGEDEILVDVLPRRRVKSPAVVVGDGDAHGGVETGHESTGDVAQGRCPLEARSHRAGTGQTVTTTRRTHVPRRRLSTRHETGSLGHRVKKALL